jgi:hypothetical protein
MDDTSGITRWRKRPVTVKAVQWTGDNLPEVRQLAGECFDPLDEQDRANCDDPEATAQVYDKLHSTWVLVFTGQWIVRGVKGEYYPCAHEVLSETADPAGSPEGDARLLEAAAGVMRERFGRLTAGDLIDGLAGAAAGIRAQGGIIRPAEPVGDPWPERPGRLYDGPADTIGRASGGERTSR